MELKEVKISIQPYLLIVSVLLLNILWRLLYQLTALIFFRCQTIKVPLLAKLQLIKIYYRSIENETRKIRFAY